MDKEEEKKGWDFAAVSLGETCWLLARSVGIGQKIEATLRFWEI